MEPSRLAVFLCLIAIIPFARSQECPIFEESLLGSTSGSSTTGLVRDAIAAVVGEGATVNVQVHASNIVCLRSGRTRDTYTGVSIVVNYTCSGAPVCTGNPTLSQFDFGCAAGFIWLASVGGSADSIVTTPPTGSLSTTLRTDCGVCLSPNRAGFGTVTNNEQHCGSCNAACNIGFMRCFNSAATGCCNFYENNMCVVACTSPLVPDSNFDCVNDCPVLTVANGMVSYQPPGTPPLVGANASYDCDNGYSLGGNNMRTCQDISNGTWTGSDPSCIPFDCDTLTAPSNGMVDVSQGTTFGQMATYSCNGGYELTGGATRTCQTTGWSGSAPTCVRRCIPDCVNGTCTNGVCMCSLGFVGRDCSEICREETTGFFLWPPTPVGITRSLPCPNTTTIVNRTCNPLGIWDSVDLSLCIPISSINTDNITVDNYDQTITAVSGAVSGAATSEQEQTTGNLATVADVFARSAALVDNNTIIIREETVQELVRILEGLQQWNVDVLQTDSSNIVQSFETIVSTFAQQSRNDTFLFMTETILFVAELINPTELATTGRSFSSSGQIGTTNRVTLGAGETAAAYLPASLFQLITRQGEVGVFFAVYDAGVLFPIRNATRNPETNSSITAVVGSPVLAATVGPGLDFVEPVRILLRLNEELENVSSGQPQCVSWDFTQQSWTTEGCQTELSGGCAGAMKEGCVVTCNCNHLTNFAILVDICSRFQDCEPSPIETVLEVLSIIGAVLSLIGIVATIITLLVFKKLRERDATKYHIQLCISLFCMLIVFVSGIDRADESEPYAGCVVVSVLIHYFTLVAVMWMGAEAVLMFQKLVIVFVRITTKFIIAVSFVCWLVPIIPVVIPLAVDLSDVVSRDLIVRRTTDSQRGFCFISDAAVFFATFLGPIFAVLLFNVVMFVLVIGVLIRHSRNTLGRSKDQMNKKTTIRLLISITGVMFLFGLTWLFGALTVTGFGGSGASTAFQILFVILNAFQGFFIFLFLCVFSKDARESWLEVFTCGRYKSKLLHPLQAKYTSSATAQKKVKTASSNLASSNLSTSVVPSTDNFNSSTYDLTEVVPLASAAGEEKKEKPPMVTFKGSPEVHETDIDNDQKADLGSLERKDPALERPGSADSKEHSSPSQWREDGLELKARVKRYSTKKAHKHHVESAEVDFLDGDSDGSDEPDDTKP